MKKSTIIYAHITFWVIYLVTRSSVPALLRFVSLHEYGKISTYLSFSPLVFFYIGYLGIMKIKWRKKYLIFSALGIISIYLILLLISKKAFAYALLPISSLFIWLTIGSLFRLFTDWVKKKNELVILEKENLKSNIALLQNQINPHFLFNTLHNIDTLIYDNKEAASKSIEKLSDIMRYMLNEAKTDFVDLQKEMNHLENYLSLEKLRLKNEHFLNYSTDGNFKGVKIAPMMLISFVENAFKHAVDSTIENGIILKINLDNGFLNFYCENQFDQSETDKDKVHGIGLETVKKRLDLIYKNRYNLTINTDNSVYKVNLEINLNED